MFRQSTNSAAESHLSTFAFPLTRLDMAGAFGDIGVLFPIAIALITLNQLNPTAVFLAAGLTYILAGRFFQIPISVQPLKAVAAIAFAKSLDSTAIASGGILLGILLAIVAVTNSAAWLAKLFSLPIVRGIQLGLGLLLAREGFRLIFNQSGILAFASGFSLGGWQIALGAALLLILFHRSKRYPAALVLLMGGIALGTAAVWGKALNLSWGPVQITLLHPTLNEFSKVLTLLVLPQFALTFGNAIVATENTARMLYGTQARRVTIRALSLSFALVNVLAGLIEAAPMCHGSGGITAHNKFGARTAKSSYVIGGICLLLAISGRAATVLLHLIPVAVLGVFLIYVGIQHASFLRDVLRRWPLLLIAVSIGVVSFVTTNLMWGFLTGFALQGGLWVLGKIQNPIGNLGDPSEPR